MAYINNNGQIRVGVRSGISNSPIVQPAFSASLLQSLYGVWNGDTTTNELSTSIFGAWNGETPGTSLDSSIFAVYNADGDANDSKGTNHGTLVNGATFSTGKIGQSFQFDGTNDYLKLPNNSLNFTGDFSVSFWMKLGSLNQTSYIIDSAGFSGIGTTGWVLNLTSGNLNFTIHNNNTASSIAANYVLTSTSVWYHIVITSKSGYNAIYINNSLIMSNTSTMRPNYVSSPYSIPYIGVFKTVNTQFFNGNIDLLNIWQKELTTDEITQLYNSGNGAQYPYSSQSLPSPKDSVGTNHGSLMNGVAFSTGKIGNAFSFDGVNDYVSFPTDSWNSLVGTDLTISLWVKFTSTANQTLISNMSSPSINVWSGWEIRLVGGQPTIYMWNNTSTGVGAQGGVVSTNTWYHIVATRKKGSRTRIYINGSLAQTDTNTPDPSISGTYYPNIGHLQYSSSFHALYMANGSLIDSVNLWSKEISADEVTQLYNSGTGAQYPFTGTFSSAGNQLGMDNGTLVNGCYLSDGKIGKAFTFDGVNDYVQLPNDSLRFTGDFSISMWVNFLSLSATYQVLLSSYKTGGLYGTGFAIYRSSGGDLQFEFKDFSNLNQYNIRGFIPQVNTWYHLTFVRKSSSYSNTYINGVLQTGDYYPNNSVKTINPTYQSGQIVQIGSHNSSLFSSIKIDALTAYQKELTQSEITELYNSGNGKQITATPIVQSGLVLNLDASRKSSYPDTGTTWTDISGTGNNGTMVNGPIFGTASGGQITFDGVNDYVDLGTKSSLAPGTSDFTVSFWINPSSWSMTYSPFFTTAITNGLWIGKHFSHFVLRTYNVADDIQYSVLPTLNTWTMVTVNRSGGVARIYYNDVMVASAANSRNYVTGNSYIGTDYVGSSNYINSKLSSFYYYNRALSTTEITQNFNATKTRFGY